LTVTVGQWACDEAAAAFISMADDGERYWRLEKGRWLRLVRRVVRADERASAAGWAARGGSMSVSSDVLAGMAKSGAVEAVRGGAEEPRESGRVRC
jgi:hypothetical protein